MLTFKSLAEFVRMLKVGMRFECTHHTIPKLSGARVVTRAQKKALACRRVVTCPQCKTGILRPCARAEDGCVHCDACGWNDFAPDTLAVVGETWAYFPSAAMVKITPRSKMSGSVRVLRSRWPRRV